VQNEAIAMKPPERQQEEWEALILSIEAANVPKWAQRSQESIWKLGGGGVRIDFYFIIQVFNSAFQDAWLF
jgi:hypothetical protein